MNKEQILAVVKQTQRQQGACEDLASIIAEHAIQIAFGDLPYNDEFGILATEVEQLVKKRILSANTIESIQYLVEEATREQLTG